MVSFADIAAAHERIKPHALRTPAVTSTTVDAMTEATVFFKCENLQRMGAFKFRGAYNALSQLSDERKKRGVITCVGCSQPPGPAGTAGLNVWL